MINAVVCRDEGEDWMVKRFATALITPIVRMVEWIYSPRAQGIDLCLSLLAGGWAALMILRPHLFDRGSYVGMSWMADEIWIAFFTILTILHTTGLVRPSLRNLRCGASLLSAWIWISVAASLAKIEVTTGVLAYSVVGMGALTGAIYLSGQPRKAG